MEDKKQVDIIREGLRNANVPAEAMLSLTKEVGKVFAEDVSEKENLLKIFLAGFLYLMEKYFAEIGFKLHDWLDEPLPEVAEDAELRAKYEKLRRKMRRITSRPYKRIFRFIYYKEWDIEKKIPLHEFDSEGYNLEFNKTENQMRAAEAVVERDVKNRQAEIMNANLEKMLAAIFYGFEASGKIQHPLVEHVLQSANIEHFLELARRLCVVLQADVKNKNGCSSFKKEKILRVKTTCCL